MRVSTNLNWKEAALAAIVAGAAVADAALDGPNDAYPHLSHGHASHARRHMDFHHKKNLQQRDEGICEFPKDAGLIAVTPDQLNGGWAMAPDMPCKPGMFCPYACPPGQLMAQWDPTATEYTHPQSVRGGLECTKEGKVKKPFPNKPYCTPGAGTVGVKNKAVKNVAFCQTVLPGYEDMLIPTDVENDATLAVPGTDYWAETAAHYYINPPGVSKYDACVWGSNKRPVGNWSPYVTGTNQDGSGKTFVTLGWNPIYLEDTTPFRDEVPDWGVRITCDGDCEGLPCEINPNIHKVNEVKQPREHPPGAGGAQFCVVGVPKGSTATVEVFDKDSGESLDEAQIVDQDGKKKQMVAQEAIANDDEKPAERKEKKIAEPEPEPTPSPEPEDEEQEPEEAIEESSSDKEDSTSFSFVATSTTTAAEQKETKETSTTEASFGDRTTVAEERQRPTMNLVAEASPSTAAKEKKVVQPTEAPASDKAEPVSSAGKLSIPVLGVAGTFLAMLL